MTIEPAEVERLGELLERATSLPWEISDGERAPYFYLEIRGPLDGDVNGDTGQHIIVGGEPICTFLDNERDYDDADLIVAAINALPALLSDLSSAREELERAKKVIKPFAAIRVHKSEEGNGDAMIGVKVHQLRAAAAFLAPEQRS